MYQLAHSNWTPPSSSMESEDDGYSGNSNSRRVRSQSPPPPPPPPNRVSNSPAPYKQERPLNEAVMHIELGNVLAMLRSQPRIEVTKTPDVYISQKSTPSEVKSWLKAKGFPDKIVKTLGGMDGNELFALTKKQLEDICGKEEGRRLDSQITVSRNFSGYKTARSSELRAILDKARARAENGKDEHDAPAFKSKSAVSASDAVTESNTRKNAAKSRPRVYQQSTPPPPPPVPPKASNYHADSSDEIFSSDDDGKSTLGRMLRQKRGEMLRKN